MKDIVLITGGMGYLGGRIAVAQNKWQVRLSSQRPTSAPSWLPQAQTVVLDVLDLKTMDAALKGVRAVVHLAALNEIQSKNDPNQARAVNTIGTQHLLEAAIRAQVERFIYFSTAHVYGAPLAGHLTEHSSTVPTHPYATTHLEAEKFVSEAHTQERILGIVLRLSNGYGAPTHPDVDRWTLLVNDLCMQAVRDRKLVLNSSGLQRRDFVALEDVGLAVSHFLNLSRKDCGNGLFNVGGDCSLTVWEMVQRIAKCCHQSLGFEPQIIRPQPLPGETALDLHYDISKLKSTGFVLQGNMDEEIKQTLKICQSMHQGKKL